MICNNISYWNFDIAKQIMTPALQTFVQTIKAAREKKGLSQRALAAKIGVPQSHISKIEAGVVDLQTSSLIEIARALDLELMLIPRALLPAAQALQRGTESEAQFPFESLIAESLDRLARKVGTKARRSNASQSDVLHALTNTIADLRRLRLGTREAEQIQRLIGQIIHALDATTVSGRLPNEKRGFSEASQSLEAYAQQLRALRNAIAHGMIDSPSAPQAAYQPDEDDSRG
jgi:transcriptional regulator with XRE-family HTH domain